MAEIFISYRNKDTGDITGRIYDHLAGWIGKDRVFKDHYSLSPGMDYREELRKAASTCKVMIVVIGDQWLNIKNDQNQRRLDLKSDWVRIEVATALARQPIPVIPVLVKNASLPSEQSLPKSLSQLAYRQTVTVRDDPHFINDMQRLIQEIKQYLPSPEPPTAPTANPQNAPGTMNVSVNTSGGQVMMPFSQHGDVTFNYNAASGIEGVRHRRQQLKDEIRPKIAAQLRNYKDIEKNKLTSRQDAARQRRGMVTLLALIPIVAISVAAAIAINILAGVIVGVVLFATLAIWSARRSRLSGKANDSSDSSEVQFLRSYLELIDEMVNRSDDEIERLTRR